MIARAVFFFFIFCILGSGLSANAFPGFDMSHIKEHSEEKARDEAVSKKVRELEKRTFLLEKKLKQDAMQTLEARTVELHKQLDDRAQNHLGYFSAGLTAIGVLAGILALTGVGVTIFSTRAYRSEIKLKKMEYEKYTKEIEELKKQGEAHVEEIKKCRADAEEKLKDFAPRNDDKVDEDTLRAAKQVEESSDRINFFRSQAILAQNDKNWREAQFCWRKVRELAPKDENAMFGLGLASARMFDDTEETLYLLEEADMIFQHISDSKNKLSLLNNWALVLSKLGAYTKENEKREYYWAESEKKYREFLHIRPDYPSALSNFAMLLTEKLKYYEEIEDRKPLQVEAEEYLKRALKIDHNHISSMGNYGILLLEMARFAENSQEKEGYLSNAKMFFNKIASMEPPSFNIVLMFAYAAALSGNVTKCISLLKERSRFGVSSRQLLKAIDQSKIFDTVKDIAEFQRYLQSLKEES